jgi:Glycosyl hydrolase family 26
VYWWFPPVIPAAIDVFSQWAGKPVEIGSAFTNNTEWGAIVSPDWQLGPWSQWVKAKPGRNLSLAVAMWPKGIGGTLAYCAAGQYDSHYVTLANNLAKYGLLSAYLRLGWEMDGSWYPWAANAGSGKEASYAACFRRIVTVMRQAQPTNSWKFVFNPTTDGGRSLAWLEKTWPGDAYVDVLGVDHYDASWAANTYPYPSNCDAACRLARQKNAWASNEGNLNRLRDFALARGKPLAFPEWGVITRSDGHGGGDDPYFMQKMHEFIANPANKVDHHIYMNVSNESQQYDSRITDYATRWDGTGPTRFPLSAAKYKELFGPGSR